MVVTVFGSINMDLVVHTPRFPDPAETITGYEFYTTPGGKGANQAVATARLGIPTKLIGRVGDDSFGKELCYHLKKAGVDITDIIIDNEVSSGVALIAIDDAAQNISRMFDNIDTYNGGLDLDLGDGSVLKFTESLKSEWIIVDPTAKPDSDKAPDSLKMTAIRTHKLERIE